MVDKLHLGKIRSRQTPKQGITVAGLTANQIISAVRSASHDRLPMRHLDPRFEKKMKENFNSNLTKDSWLPQL